jgi:uncharacterized membrane protein
LYTVTLLTMLAFATLIYFAFRNRFNPAAHKRLILIATIALLDAAFVRWPVPAAWWGLRAASFVCTIPLLLLIMGYDYWSTGKIHRATIWASVFVLQQVRGSNRAFRPLAGFCRVCTDSCAFFAHMNSLQFPRRSKCPPLTL